MYLVNVINIWNLLHLPCHLQIHRRFSGAFAKLRRATISSIICVCPSILPFVCMEQLGSHWTDFHEIWYLRIFHKSVEEIEVSLKSDKDNGYLTWRPVHNFDHFWPSSSYNAKCLTEVVEQTETHISYFLLFSFSKNRAICEIMWKNIVQPGRPYITIWRMRIACWIPKATNTKAQCVILINFPL
jgi:hypothetical protein